MIRHESNFLELGVQDGLSKKVSYQAGSMV